MRVIRIMLENSSDELLAVFRGTDERGYKDPKPTKGGVYGDGLYFYLKSTDAKVHATYPRGGVLTAMIKRKDCEVHDDTQVVVVKDAKKVQWRGRIPLEDTKLSGKAWDERVQQALRQ